MLDFSREEILAVLQTARELKERFKHGSDFAQAASCGSGKMNSARYAVDSARSAADALGPLAGKTLAMIFQKPSLRTRVSFETGMTKLGGHAIYLSPTDISLGKRETTEDIAIVLSRYVDIIMARVFGHDIVEELAKHATVPVINGLSDFSHPCQIMADLLTILERKGRLEGLHACYIGDGNNVAHSLMFGAARVGMNMTIITPKGYEPQAEVVESSSSVASVSGSTITVSNDLASAAGADVVYTDVWASMGQEEEAAHRKQVFSKYRIDADTMKIADPKAIILHCLPAHYGDEIDYETSRTPNSAIFDQAENRMHAQNAVMVHLAG
ncbi:MAG: ornithine carbamoyltransferase [Planctomycetes bacterium]|nr:ornithine carbamoyltransferase [Planctomycetota bacterium]